MNEWTSDRKPEGQEGFEYRLTNRKFEKTLKVSRDDLEDDTLQIYSSKIDTLASAYAYNVDSLTIAAMQSTSQPCFDGLTYFNASHFANPKKSQGAFSNLRTLALTTANFDTAMEDMMSFVDIDGAPADIIPTHLFVPPQLRKPALRIVGAGLQAEEISSTVQTTTHVASENVNAGVVQVVVVPRLANQATTWYLADLSKSIKPMIYQLRRALEMVSFTDPSSPAVFTADEYLFGTSCRHAVGYSYPQLMLRSTP
jgi:phage major head subunit gpT-like protein